MAFFSSMSADNTLNLVHTIKVMIAILIGFLIIQLHPEPHGIWIVISTIVIMMAHASLNAQYDKALSRTIGTVVGAILGICTLTLHPGLLLNTVLLMAVVALFCYIKIINRLSQYAVVLGLITYSMLIITPQATWQLGALRAGEIISGIIISLLVSSLIFPISSKKMLLLYLDKNWSALHDYADRILVARISRDGDTPLRIQEQKILQRHNTIEELYSAKTLTKKQKPGRKIHLLIRYQLGIYRYITLLDIVTHQYLIEDKNLSDMVEIKHSYLALTNALTSIDSHDFLERVDNLKHKKNALEKLILIQDHAGQSKTTAAHTLIFSLNRIQVILEKYYKLYCQITKK